VKVSTVLDKIDSGAIALGDSSFGDAPSEGVVVRRLDPEAQPRIAKCVAAGYRRPTDERFGRDRRLNRLVQPTTWTERGPPGRAALGR